MFFNQPINNFTQQKQLLKVHNDVIIILNFIYTLFSLFGGCAYYYKNNFVRFLGVKIKNKLLKTNYGVFILNFFIYVIMLCVDF